MAIQTDIRSINITDSDGDVRLTIDAIDSDGVLLTVSDVVHDVCATLTWGDIVTVSSLLLHLSQQHEA